MLKIKTTKKKIKPKRKKKIKVISQKMRNISFVLFLMSLPLFLVSQMLKMEEVKLTDNNKVIKAYSINLNDNDLTKIFGGAFGGISGIYFDSTNSTLYMLPDQSGKCKASDDLCGARIYSAKLDYSGLPFIKLINLSVPALSNIKGNMSGESLRLEPGIKIFYGHPKAKIAMILCCIKLEYWGILYKMAC